MDNVVACGYRVRSWRGLAHVSIYSKARRRGWKEKSGLSINSPLFSIVPNQLSPLRHHSLRGSFAFCFALFLKLTNRYLPIFRLKNRTLLADYKILRALFTQWAKETVSRRQWEYFADITKEGGKDIDTETDFIGHLEKDRVMKLFEQLFQLLFF